MKKQVLQAFFKLKVSLWDRRRDRLQPKVGSIWWGGISDRGSTCLFFFLGIGDRGSTCLLGFTLWDRDRLVDRGSQTCVPRLNLEKKN